VYNNLRRYINLKGMIGMPVTTRHVWGHAYECDKLHLKFFPSKSNSKSNVQQSWSYLIHSLPYLIPTIPLIYSTLVDCCHTLGNIAFPPLWIPSSKSLLINKFLLFKSLCQSSMALFIPFELLVLLPTLQFVVLYGL
jgi:hypothetical protein